jgi:hypothetical protein
MAALNCMEAETERETMMYKQTVRLCICLGAQTSIESGNTNYFQQVRIWKNAQIIQINKTVTNMRKETTCAIHRKVPCYIQL